MLVLLGCLDACLPRVVIPELPPLSLGLVTGTFTFRAASLPQADGPDFLGSRSAGCSLLEKSILDFESGGAALWKAGEGGDTVTGTSHTPGGSQPASSGFPSSPRFPPQETQILILSSTCRPPSLSPNLALTHSSWRLTSSEVEDPIVAV